MVAIARGFFEALVADNLDIGRPHNVEIIFGRKIRRDTKGVFRTAIDRRDNGGVLVNVSCKHSRIKQYLFRPLVSASRGWLLRLGSYRDEAVLRVQERQAHRGVCDQPFETGRCGLDV